MKKCYLALCFAFIAVSPLSLACDSDQSGYIENPSDELEWHSENLKNVQTWLEYCGEILVEGCSQVRNFVARNPLLVMGLIEFALIDPAHAANCTGCAVCNCFCILPSGYGHPIGMAADIKQCYDMCGIMNKTYPGGFKACPK